MIRKSHFKRRVRIENSTVEHAVCRNRSVLRPRHHIAPPITGADPDMGGIDAGASRDRFNMNVITMLPMRLCRATPALPRQAIRPYQIQRRACWNRNREITFLQANFARQRASIRSRPHYFPFSHGRRVFRLPLQASLAGNHWQIPMESLQMSARSKRHWPPARQRCDLK